MSGASIEWKPKHIKYIVPDAGYFSSFGKGQIVEAYILMRIAVKLDDTIGHSLLAGNITQIIYELFKKLMGLTLTCCPHKSYYY